MPPFPTTSPRPIIIFQLGFWCATALMVTVVDSVAAPENYSIPQMLLSLGVGLLVTTCVIVVYTYYERRFLRFRIPIFLLLTLLAAFIWGNVMFLLLAEYLPNQLSLSERFIRSTISTVWPLALWSGLFFLVKLLAARREQQAVLNQAQLENKKAQLRTLRYQLNPHFLFNMLNSIDVSVQSKDNDTAHKMIQQLSSFLRNSLQQGEQDKITLRQELAIIEDFIDISRHRFSDAMDIRTKVEPECLSAMLPPMLLQPLIENAIKYAWTQTDKGEIDLYAQRLGDKLIIGIKNSKQNNQQEIGTGTGLSNTKERLQLIYGDDASVELDSTSQVFTVEVHLPWETVR